MLRWSAVGLLCLFAAVDSRAAVVTAGEHSFDIIASVEASVGQSFGGVGTTLAFNQFNASLGKLTDVVLSITGEAVVRDRVIAEGQSPELEPLILLASSGDLAFELTSAPVDLGTVFSDFLGNAAQCQVAYLARCDNESIVSIDIDQSLSLFDPRFIGDDSYELRALLSSAITLDIEGLGGATFAASHSDRLRAHVRIDYVYNPLVAQVPEPATFTLAAAALTSGIGWRLRRRRVKG